MFGPAQRLHGATYVVDATFRAAELDDDGVVVDIGAAAELLHEVLGELTYRNLDDEPDARRDEHHDRGAGAGGRRPAGRADRATARSARGAGSEGLAVTLHESHVAWASYDAAAVSAVHVVVPAGIDDPARVSGGNRYDREVCDELRAAGWAGRRSPPGRLAAPGRPRAGRAGRRTRRAPEQYGTGTRRRPGRARIATVRARGRRQASFMATARTFEEEP